MGKEVVHNEEVVRKLVVRSAVRVLDIGDIKVDRSYQRDLKEGYKKIISEYNPDALGILLVAEREDGWLYVVDGQQRLEALKKLEKKTVRAEVFNSRGVEHEAEVFKLVNQGRTKLNSWEVFRSLLASHDPHAWAVKEAVESCGFHLGTGGTPAKEWKATNLGGVNTLLKWYHRCKGVAGIKFALGVAKECWPGDREGIHSSMVSGFCFWWLSKKGTFDNEKLLARLKTVKPNKILYAATQSSLGGDRAVAVAEQIERVYRKRSASRKPE